MRQSKYFLLFIVFFYSSICFSSPDFKKILKRYSQNSGVKMLFKKKTILKLLNKQKISHGKIFLSSGQILLAVKDHFNTRILFDGNDLWYIRSPKNQEIVKIKLEETKEEKKPISFLFNPDLFFQKFRFISSRFKGRSQILNFEPIDAHSEIQRFSAKVEGKLILMIWLKWKDLGNEEEYSFSHIQFNQDIPAHYFQVSRKINLFQ